MKNRIGSWTVAVVALGLVAILAGCSGMGGVGGGEEKNDPKLKSLELVPFESCKEMAGEIREAMIARMEAELDGMRSRCRCVDLSGHCGEQPISFVSEGLDAAAVGATGTNLQEAGVDEADLIKTDGKFAYAIVGGEIRVVKVWPFADFRRVATISPEGTPKGMYLSGTLLAVISVKGEVWSGGVLVGGGDVDDSPPTLQQPAQVIEQVYDVSKPASPVLKSTRTVTGSLLDSRRFGTKLHVVIRNSISMPQLDYAVDIPYEQLPECPAEGDAQPTQAMLDKIAALKEANRAKIEALVMGDMLPKADDVKRHDCTTAHRSEASRGTDILTVVTSDVSDDSSSPSALSIVGGGGTLYASAGALYVAGSQNFWTVDEKTLVHRFALVSGLPKYSGTGEVEGVLVDNGFVGSHYSGRFSMSQFAMSEHEGFLRVATTKSGGVAGSDNRVTVLDISKATLDEVGVASGMGAGERIRSVRFIGTKAYVVTFKQVDPLYVVDLSEPRAPKIAGELKIPGFSTYLHPLDDSHLIGLGFDAEDEGSFAWTQGLKLSLFDISDPEKPVEIGHRVIGGRGSYSPAVEEHHAFTIDADGRIALPVDLFKNAGSPELTDEFDFAGVILLKADSIGAFADLGAIRMYEETPVGDGWGFLSSAILRTVIIEDGSAEGIVTLTTEGVRLNLIDAGMTAVGGVE